MVRSVYETGLLKRFIKLQSFPLKKVLSLGKSIYGDSAKTLRFQPSINRSPNIAVNRFRSLSSCLVERIKSLKCCRGHEGITDILVSSAQRVLTMLKVSGLRCSHVDGTGIGGADKMTYSVNIPKGIKTLLVITAMDVENDAILKDVQHEAIWEDRVYGIKVDTFKAGNRQIMVTKCGVGLVSAALTVAMIAEKYSIDAILVSGVGGALVGKLNIGDIVLSTYVLQHDCKYSGSKAEMMAPGELFLSLPPDKRIDPFMKANTTLVDWVEELLTNETSSAVFRGIILSGNEFAASTHRKEELAALDDRSLLIDMEAAGIAQIARKLNIPFVVAKTVADRLYPDNSISQDYVSFLNAAANNSAKIVHRLAAAFEEMDSQ